jgi:hypothetical protein
MGLRLTVLQNFTLEKTILSSLSIVFFSQSYWVFFTMQRPEPEIKPTFLVKST